MAYKTQKGLPREKWCKGGLFGQVPKIRKKAFIIFMYAYAKCDIKSCKGSSSVIIIMGNTQGRKNGINVQSTQRGSKAHQVTSSKLNSPQQNPLPRTLNSREST